MIRTITPIFSIVLALIIFFFFVKPMFAEIKLLQNETAQYENAVLRATELNAELTSKLDEKRSYPPEAFEKLDALVPSSIDEVRILNDLNEMARSHSMLFGNVSVANDSDDAAGGDETMAAPTVTSAVTYNDLKVTDITFSLIGTYEQFKAFLADVEKSLVMLEVLNIDFATGEGIFQQYSLTARVFSLPTLE